MNHGTSAKVIRFQYSTSPNNIKLARIRKYPFVAIFKTGIAVAFNKAFQLGDLDIELECPTVAVAGIGLELRSLLGHCLI